MRGAPRLDETQRTKGALVAGQLDARLQFDQRLAGMNGMPLGGFQQALADAEALMRGQHSQLAKVEMVGLFGDEGAADDRVAGQREEADLGLRLGAQRFSASADARRRADR